ncbi:MAG: Abi family protein [Actinomycetaceae bacterium]|nr:Abi family protein [Actinomycetaceae bacterium]
MNETKPFLSYAQQVDLLVSRGMCVTDRKLAERQLEILNYYRLSGYWHTMRQVDPSSKASLDTFREGASFELVVALYHFDESLRKAIFAELAPIELAMRALIGHQLGQVDPLVHLDPRLLGAIARQPGKRSADRTIHDEWLRKYDIAVGNSKEDFVAHHQRQYGGKLPIWVAVDVLDWGMLSHLYRMSPFQTRDSVAQKCRLSAPQLESWLKSLNILRNYAAHHARVFNRGFDIKPKLSNDACFDGVRMSMNRAFGQLSLVQYLHRQLGLSEAVELPRVLATYPRNDLVPFERLGASKGWQQSSLWSIPSPSSS